MKMNGVDAGNHLDDFRQQIKHVKHLLSRARAKQVQASSIKDGSKKLVSQYFTTARPQLRSCGLDDESLGGLDEWMQQLLTLSQKSALKASYLRDLKAIDQELNGIEVALVTATAANTTPSPKQLDGKETRIAATLGALVGSAGLSYEQACRDLREDSRLSYRGAASELREALREVLDYLAPDRELTQQPGFKLEKDRTGPTMQQKVRYILMSRGKKKSQTEAPENCVSVVEDGVGALARAVYNRSSLSTHLGTSKQEVQQIKAYIDVVLGELLEIAGSPTN